MHKLLITAATIAVLSIATSAANALDCEQIWFHNNSWCGYAGNYSCAPCNAMCKPSCSGTPHMKCDQMSWCTVIKTTSYGPVCRPNCEAITNNDACWSTSGCWFYNGKCMASCLSYSDNETFCLNSPSGSYCTWDGIASKCRNDYSIAVDYESCAKLAGMSYSGVKWDFQAQKCGSSCAAQPNQTTCNALGSRCQWYPNSATDGNRTGSCVDNCAKGISEFGCLILSGCYWLGGSCKRSCRYVNVFPTKNDPSKYDTSQCDALDYCGVSVSNTCRDKKCSAARNPEECGNLDNCVYVAGSCISSCDANSTFSDIACPTGKVAGVTLCERKFGWCQPVACGNFTTLGRDACYMLGGYGSCMFYQDKCQRACAAAYSTSECSLNSACSFDNTLGCYLSGCNNAGQDADTMLCAYGRYKDNNDVWQFCNHRLNKCYANSCSTPTTQSDCMALTSCTWVNNTYNFKGCFTSSLGASFDNCWTSNSQFDTTKCECDLACSVQGAAGCGGMCSVDKFGLCSHSASWMYDSTCATHASSPTGTTTSGTASNGMTTQSPSSSASSALSPLSHAGVGAIAGGVAGGIVFLVVVIGSLWYFSKNKKGGSSSLSTDQTPYVEATNQVQMQAEETV